MSFDEALVKYGLLKTDLPPCQLPLKSNPGVDTAPKLPQRPSLLSTMLLSFLLFSFTMETIDRDAVTAQVATMLASRFEKALKDPQATAASLEAAVFPLFGLRWIRSIVRAVDSRWLNRLLAFARNSPLPYRTYKSTASLLNDALADDCSFPPVCGGMADFSRKISPRLKIHPNGASPGGTLVYPSGLVSAL